MLMQAAALFRRLLDAVATLRAAVRMLDKRLLMGGFVGLGTTLVACLITTVTWDHPKESRPDPLNPVVGAACEGTGVDATRAVELIRTHLEEGKDHAETCALLRQSIRMDCGYATSEVDLSMLLCVAVRYHALASVADSVYGESAETAGQGVAVDYEAAVASYEELRTSGAFPGESRSLSLAFACESCDYEADGEIDTEMMTCIARRYHALAAVADSVFAQQP